MDWAQVLTIAGTNLAMLLAMIGMILWFRSESRKDWKHLDEKMEANRRETLSIIESIRLEIKDFHGRLCGIETKKGK